MKKIIRKLFQFFLPKIIKNPRLLYNERPAEYSFIFFELMKIGRGKVLDVGTGTMGLPIMLMQCGYEVDATDLRPNNFYVDVKKMDISSSALKIENQYDIITCISVIEHIPDYEQAIKNMANFCKKNGVIIITFPFNNSKYIDNINKTSKLCHVFSYDVVNKWCNDNNLKIESEKFYRMYDGDIWFSGNAVGPNFSDKENADLACFVLKKNK